MYNSIIVPVNLAHADASDKAFDTACMIARQFGAKVRVLTIVPHIDDNLRRRPEDSLPDLEAYVASKNPGGLDIEAALRTGAPHRAIPRAAEEFGADLIVMNSHNPRIADYVIGSTAAHIALHTNCSVFIVR